MSVCVSIIFNCSWVTIPEDSDQDYYYNSSPDELAEYLHPVHSDASELSYDVCNRPLIQSIKYRVIKRQTLNNQLNITK